MLGPRNYFSEMANSFDFVIVTSSIIDIIMLVVVSGEGGGSSFAALRMLRMLRLMRVARLGRLAARFPALVQVNSSCTRRSCLDSPARRARGLRARPPQHPPGPEDAFA